MDKELIVKQCKTGDREAFGLLYQAYIMPMYKVVYHYIRNSDTVWDILHDGFIIAFSQIDSLNDNSKIEPWLISIMKNLALQHIKTESHLTSDAISDNITSDDTYDFNETHILAWEEIESIINKLPEGYGKVFRLAVLDGLSHKEISEILGIAPHSSSSQLSRAKLLLRNLISDYRTKMDLLSILIIILLIIIPRLVTDNDTQPLAPSNINEHFNIRPSYKHNTAPATIISTAEIVFSNNTETAITDDTITIVRAIAPHITNDTIANDTHPHHYPHNVNANNSHSSKQPLLAHSKLDSKPDWSLTIAYSGNIGQNNVNRFIVSNPDISDGESITSPSDIEITEKYRHYVPCVINLTIDKNISQQWSIETGLRYTLLRSDFLTESKLSLQETSQRIHYIGIPLKLNYRLFTYKGFSAYAHAGCALDIPILGHQSIYEYSHELNNSKTDLISIQAPLQWSIEGGLGAQYNFTPSFSIYIEPSLNYYFNSGSQIKTIRQTSPAEFNIPVGLRFSW